MAAFIVKRMIPFLQVVAWPAAVGAERVQLDGGIQEGTVGKAPDRSRGSR